MAEDEYISNKTWSRNIEPVNKLGYMDGVVDGQTNVFQSSFDLGYLQGFSFGLQLGLTRSNSVQGHGDGGDSTITDQRRINCQICLNNTTTQDSITNLYNAQQEKNIALFKVKNCI